MHLLAAWLTLSIIIGSLVYYLETEQIDEWVVSIALDETKAFVEASTGSGDFHLQERETLLARMKEMTRHNFVIVELYNIDGAKYIEVVREGSRKTEEQLKLNAHDKPIGDHIWYQKQKITEGVFLQVFVPIISNNGEK